MENKFAFTVGGPDNWYDQYIQAGIELISAYIEHSEIYNSLAITDYHKYKETEIVEHEYGANIMIHFRSIDGGTFDAEDTITNHFPNLNRRATLVMVTSMFEKELKQLCDSLNSLLDINKPFKKEKGSLLANIKDYLCNVAKIKMNTSLEHNWSDLMCLQSLRNNIVHNFGKLAVSNTHLENYIRANKNIWIDKSRDICLNHEFLKDLVPSFIILCKELQEAIRERANKM
ncbi:hypothetical protein H8K90_15105 [Winogradskyella echinorum]|uniref:RiboL-PSP-HEPN domain-containing protein n=1 Tax=Winogradskyella echinorum TaxID=538189 RepID=A0ABR6Y4W0_9FLAO|nr:hypothetical protein [Winogradskyella echinorum]MBC3847724.1 hypothetical protein [Winogradskyella echinorum]MBC5752072.1 hypothetical protein [Winogradskyella echinorum]